MISPIIIENLFEIHFRESEDVRHSDHDKFCKSIDLWRYLISEIADQSKLHLHTWFTKVTFLANLWNLDEKDCHILQSFRRLQDTFEPHNQSQYNSNDRNRAKANLAIIAKSIAPDLLLPRHWEEALEYSRNEVKLVENTFKNSIKGVITSFDRSSQHAHLQPIDNNQSHLVLTFNKYFEDWGDGGLSDFLSDPLNLPLVVQVYGIQYNHEGFGVPDTWVIEPDFLVDVTAVAECFLPFGHQYLLHILKKFLPSKQSMSLLTGNMANFFLDSLVTDGDQEFNHLFKINFINNALDFACLTDDEVRSMRTNAYQHFIHLKQVIDIEFSRLGISTSNCSIEPSFVDPLHGLQGRLDLLHIPSNKEAKKSIIELKSSKPFMPNKFGLNTNHYAQTLLYDTMIKSVFGQQYNHNAYILYSGSELDTLRLAPPFEVKIKEAMDLRNRIIVAEKRLNSYNDLNRIGESILGQLSPTKLPMIKGFHQRDLSGLDSVLSSLSTIEEALFMGFLGVIARENWIGKVGDQRAENQRGQANLWLNTRSSKEEQFEFLGFLKIEGNFSNEKEPMLFLRRTKYTPELVNFRKGDIAIFYPNIEGKPDGIQEQLFKCTIIDVTESHVAIRLRSRQYDQRIFLAYPFWHIEHDRTDHGFKQMYEGLFAFASLNTERREKWMGIRPTAKYEDSPLEYSELSQEQNRILSKMVNAEEYFMLWGPPGTGKTSVMLKYFVKYIFENTDQTILLVAYTNKAVDEICEAIEKISIECADNYIRIGSRYSTDRRFIDKLLDNKVGEIQSRKHVKEMLFRHRIIVGTIASLNGKSSLFDLVHFDKMVVDEASQVLEPLLMNLISKVPSTVLIGDHRQLPAIVCQPEFLSKVHNSELLNLGYENFRDSLFERLYKRVKNKQWDWAFDVLKFQGRMHQDIQRFPAEVFYDRQLEVMPFNENQINHLKFDVPFENDILLTSLAANRVVFINTPINHDQLSTKTNVQEALICNRIVDAFFLLYRHNRLTISSSSFGIITPYKAQIAAIQQLLNKEWFDITVDTVERYQGSAKDIIIISLCTNSRRQLKTLIAKNSEEIDRKLNVALTRARQHVIILGNKALLDHDTTYQKLIESSLIIDYTKVKM